jgi:predicted phage terminase large subunit-like protein
MQGDQLGRAVGQALWPERYDTPVLEEIKRTLGSYYFSALYQGLPIPESGALFKRKWFNYAERINGNYVLKQGDHVTMVPVDKCIVFMTVDLAISTDDSADYTCIGTWALTPNKDLILLDVVRERIEGPDQLRVIASVRERFGASRIGIERTQYQLSLVQAAVRAGLPAVGLKADGGNKVARALTVAARYEANAVYHTKGPWLDEYEKELLSFDKGEHDDQVDMAAYAAQFLMQRSTGVTATVLG